MTPHIVFVSFEADFDDSAAYIDGKQIDRIDSDWATYNGILDELQRRGLITWERRMLSKEAAVRFRGTDRFQPYEKYDVIEREIALEKAATLRLKAAELEAQAAALESTSQDLVS